MADASFFVSDPAEVGVDADKVEALLDRVRQEVDAGLLPACQVALARHGRIAAYATFGDASDDSLFCVFSATKAITSAAGWLVIQDGLLDVHTRVAETIPEFGTHGKEVITVEQLFTHTAGIPHAPFRNEDWFDRDRRAQRWSEWTLNWPPGSRFEYHPTSSMWVIAELIERKTGREFHEFVRERIALPLGLPDLWLSCPPEQHARIKDVCHVGDGMSDDEFRALGMQPPPANEVTEEALLRFNDADVRQVPVAGGGGIMTAAELALFYQALINGGRAHDGRQIWREDVLEFAFRVRNIHPDLQGVSCNRALGVIVAGDSRRNARGFGHTNTEQAVGHGGAGGQIAWGDPGTGLSLGYVTNGHDRHMVRQARRGVSISNRAAVCAAQA